jgi:nucleoside-diphosphate-sugar epimerase
MKTLVTGGGGFLGQAIVRQLLARGDEVRVLGRHPYPEVSALGATCVQGDVADLRVVEDTAHGIDVVFHVAAKAGMWGKAADYERANVLGTHNVVQACLTQGVSRLVHTSSPSVTFDGSDAAGADETLPYATRHLYHYGRTKAEAERHVLAANGSPHRSGTGNLLTTALRPHILYGPGDPHIVPRLVARHRQGRLRMVGDGRNLIDITYVDNAAHAHLLAADALGRDSASNAGRAYFLSDGHPVVPWVWLNTIFAGAGLPPLTKRVPTVVARAAGAVLEGTWSILRLSGEPPMTRFVAAQLGTSHWYNLAAARRDLGYEPVVDQGTATALTIEWLKTELTGGRLAGR